MEEEMFTKVEQLCLQDAIRDLDMHVAQLLAQVVEAQKEVALAKEEVMKAQREMTIAKDVAAAITDKAQKISLQTNFKILRQSLLLLKLSFNVQALDALIDTDVVNATILEVEAE